MKAPLMHRLRSDQVGEYTFLDGYEGHDHPYRYMFTGYDEAKKKHGGGGIAMLPFLPANLLKEVSFTVFKFANTRGVNPLVRGVAGFLGVMLFALALPFYALYGVTLAVRTIFTTLHALVQMVAEYLPLKLSTLLKEGTQSLFNYANDKTKNPIARGFAGFLGVLAAIGAGITGTIHFFMRTLLSPISATREAYRAGREFGARVFGNSKAGVAIGIIFGIGRLALSIGMAVLAAFVAVPIAIGAVAAALDAEMVLLPTVVSLVEALSALPMIAKLQAFFGMLAGVMQSFVPVTTASVAASTLYGAAAITAGTAAKLVLDAADKSSSKSAPLPLVTYTDVPNVPLSSARAAQALQDAQACSREATARREQQQRLLAEQQFTEAASRSVPVAVVTDPAPSAQPVLPQQAVTTPTLSVTVTAQPAVQEEVISTPRSLRAEAGARISPRVDQVAISVLTGRVSPGLMPPASNDAAPVGELATEQKVATPRQQ